MQKKVIGLLPILLIGATFSIQARAGEVGVGFLTVDIPDSAGDANSYELDVYNLTDLNNSDGGCCTGGGLLDAFPIATQLLTSVSSLNVTAADGVTPLATLGSAYFSLDADGQSLTGGALIAGFTMPSNTPGSATLTGTFSATSIELDNGTFVTINPGFSVKLTDATTAALAEGDSVEIFATTAGTATPEPGTWLLAGIGMLALAGVRVRRFRLSFQKLTGVALLGALCLAGMPFARAAAPAPIRLTTWTNPSSGVAGATTVQVVGQGFPAGTTKSNTTLFFATTCGGTVVATATPSNVSVLLAAIGEDRASVLIPGALSTTGNYFISVTADGISSSNCSEVTVTVPVKFSGACLPSSSIGLGINSTAKTATAYVPNGAWDASNTGVQVVPIEPSSTPASSVATGGDTINACSASPTGQAVCTSNGADVYVLSGATVQTVLVSGSNTTDSFSGGTCENCGVAINPNTNQAVISMGLSGFAGGYQFLNLGASPAFVGPPIGVANQPSENVVWDASRNLIISPDEHQNEWDVIQVGSGAASIAEFQSPYPTASGSDVFDSPDSAGEDCSTGIALSTNEFTGYLFLSDLTQATFTPSGTPGTPGTWTAPGQAVEFPEFADTFSAGTSGMAVAPGSHLAVVAGEFAGDSFGVVQLPATSGSGTPAPVDYVQAYLPTEPNGCTFEAGLDPHTVTAYTSPNSGKALAVMADGYFTPPGYLAIVDMAGLLAATRTAGTHSVDPSVNLLTSGIVTYVATGNSVASCGGLSGSVKPRVRGASASQPTSVNHK